MQSESRSNNPAPTPVHAVSAASASPAAAPTPPATVSTPSVSSPAPSTPPAPSAVTAPVSTPEAETVQPTPQLKEAFPGVFIDVINKSVEFEGIVPINAHDANAPMVYLEVFVCLPDTKEHEAVVMTTVKPSHVHAALLLIGLNPGKPGGWDLVDDKLVPIQPSGDALSIRLSYSDATGKRITLTPEDVIVDATTGAPFSKQNKGHWLFAGSRMVKRQGSEWYDADRAGMLIGLTTFGGETIAWSQTISPDSNIQAPEWIASPMSTPPAGTSVRVTITPLAR